MDCWKECFLLPGVICVGNAGGALWILDAAPAAGEEAAVGAPHVSGRTGALQELEQNSSPVTPTSPLPGSYLSDLELVCPAQGCLTAKPTAKLGAT